LGKFSIPPLSCLRLLLGAFPQGTFGRLGYSWFGGLHLRFLWALAELSTSSDDAARHFKMI